MHKLLAYLQLCRFAAVFTAMADIFLGYLLTHPDLSPAATFALLVAASSGLYLSGMAFNDVFDRVIDAAERPHRPIPSGRVPLGYAISFGGGLMTLGVLAAVAVGWPSTFVALLLVWCIFLYNGLLKNTLLGPFVMGSCRFLNVMLGASAWPDPMTGEATLAAVWEQPQLYVSLSLGIYIVGVTWFARKEAGVSNRWQLAGATGVVNLGLILLIAFVLDPPDAQLSLRTVPRTVNAILIIAAIGVIINRRLLVAFFDPVSTKVQAGVRTLLLSLVMLDASIVYFVNENMLYAICVILLLIPAQVMSRFLAVT
jgi:4-hydroxybenzoate polyprenyltransferase